MPETPGRVLYLLKIALKLFTVLLIFAELGPVAGALPWAEAGMSSRISIGSPASRGMGEAEFPLVCAGAGVCRAASPVY